MTKLATHAKDFALQNDLQYKNRHKYANQLQFADELGLICYV